MTVLDVEAAGPDQGDWDAQVARLPRWRGPGVGGRVVLVSPHPDDETLGLGGTLHLLAQRGVPVDLLAVTDGGASHPHVADIGRRRRRECRLALRRLGAEATTTVHELGLPDGDVGGHLDVLEAAIDSVATGAALTLAPHPEDGHPDHEAAAVAARRATPADVPVQHYPVWAWHGQDPSTSTLLADAWAIPLPPSALERKRHAIAAYRSQVTDELGPPIVPPHVVARLTRSFEVVTDR